MSWSVDYTGTPKAVAAAIEGHADKNKLSGDSLTEFNAAKPSLIGLVALNFNDSYPSAIRVIASGHAYKADGKGYSNCFVRIESIGTIVT